MKPTQLLSVQLLTALLVACGGGGSGSDNQTTTDNPGSEGNPQVDSRENETASYSISGSIVVEANARHDNDINDSNSTYGSNDSFDLAQAVLPQAIISGYVNVAGSGPSGQSNSTGDAVDIYRATLTEDQSISLSYGTSSSDLDLFVYSTGDINTAAFSSETSNTTENVAVDADGDYYIKVVAVSGAASYVLDLGDDLGASSIQSTNMDFEPGEIIVKYRDNVETRGLSAFSTVGNRVRDNLHTLNPDDVLGYSVSGYSSVSRSLFSGDVDAAAKERTLEAIEVLRQRDDVEYAEPNYRVYPAALPSDPNYSKQAHYSQINAPAAWDITTGDSSVIVAVIDTGVMSNHPDLASKLVDGYDFIRSTSYSEDGDGMDSDSNDPGDPAHGIAYHGTHVAGTIAANANNGEGGTGIAWDVKIMPLRAIAYESGSTLDLAEAIRYAAGLSNASNTLPSQRADIINMSLGTTANSSSVRNAIEEARAEGVIIVAASGNQSSTTANYPAAYEEVLSVSSVGSTNELAWYSNYGTSISIAAPGGESGDANGDGKSDSIYSTRGNSSGSPSYGYMNGTSMATPHVAGVLALMKSVNPDLTPDDVDSLLISGQMTTDLGITGKDNETGYGLIDALKSVQAAQSPFISTTASKLHLGLSTTPESITVEGYTGTLGNVSVETSHAWLVATAYSVNGSGLGSYQVSIDRSGLSDGAYEGQVTFRLGSNSTKVVTVHALQATTDPDSNLGHQYISLRKVSSGSANYQVSGTLSNGIYSFDFGSVEEGSYYLVTGSDEDNDGVICEVGESCGYFPSLTSPLSIDVSGNLDNIDLVTSVVSTSTSVGSFSLHVEGQ